MTTHTTKIIARTIFLGLVLMLAATTISVTVPHSVSAQTTGGYVPLAPLPCVPGGSVTKSQCDAANSVDDAPINFENYIQYAFNLFIFISGSAAVFMIVWGGFQYMTTDSWQGKSEGLHKAQNAVLGLVLVLVSFLLLRTIDPRLVTIPTTLVEKLDVPKVSGYLDDFTNQLAKDASLYKIDVGAIQTKANADKQVAADANQSVSDLGKQIAEKRGVPYSETEISVLCDSFKSPVHADNAEIQSLCQQREQKQLVAQVALGNARLITAIGSMGLIEAQCPTTAAPSCFAGLQKKIEEQYSIRSLLQPDQQQALQSYASYSQSVVYLKTESSDFNDKDLTGYIIGSERAANALKVYAGMQDAIAAYASQKNHDPAILDRMNKGAEAAKEFLVSKNLPPKQ